MTPRTLKVQCNASLHDYLNYTKLCNKRGVEAEGKHINNISPHEPAAMRGGAILMPRRVDPSVPLRHILLKVGGLVLAVFSSSNNSSLLNPTFA